MSVLTELLENVIAIIPALLALLLVCKKPHQIRGWAVWVVGSSAVAVLALGLLLKRLTAVCSEPIPTCEAPATVVYRIPGIFSSCVQCSGETSSQLAIILNQFALPLQAGVGVVCIVISFVITIRFVLWARTLLREVPR